jgi:protein-L-isoaspartate(D-aspartate) O-methyltransferase
MSTAAPAAHWTASWRSGYAEDCKSLYGGSIPSEASIFFRTRQEMLDFAQARRMMVDSQLRTFDVNDIPLLTAMDIVPRERFVPADRESLAYMDQDMPLGQGRAMLAPMILGRMLQALEVERGMRALDVACGLGYSSAVLAELGASVIALEDKEALVRAAEQRLQAAGVAGVRAVHGALDRGHAEGAPYDVILVNGALEKRPEALLRQLTEGGRLVCVMGGGRAAKATLFVRAGDACGVRSLFDAAAPVLDAFRAEPGFVF